MTPTATAIAITVVKLATFGASVMGLTIGFKWFNTYEFNPKKRGSGSSDSEVESLRERIKARS